jgi:glycine/D-amino acid oxidase-like deaminating enzyme/nitrite reductase/ring-hydroxylating ferredoxin subunit
MNVADERTRSIWMDTRVADAPELSSNENADVVVIGSGIAGLSTAYELATRGCSVIVVDRGEIGNGMTARTTAHLASALDDFYFELIKARDLATARALYQSLAASIDRAEAIQSAERIACDFARLDGYLFLAPDTSPSDLDDELDACRKIGIPVTDCREPVPLQIDGTHRSIRFPAQARFHPLKYLSGLAAAVQRRGGRLFANTCVTSVDEKDGTVTVKTAAGYQLTAASVVVATNSPIVDRVTIHTKQAPYRTFVIAGTLPRGTLPDALYWDTLEAYHYVRLQPLSDSQDAVIIGGEDYKSGEADDGERRFAALEQWARARIPQLGPITHRWSGQVLEPVDYVGFIGRNPGNERIYIVSGDSGQGITNGIVAGMVLSDLIVNGASPWSELYDPGRKMTGSLGEYLSENLTPLKNFAEYVTAGELSSARQLKPGEGGLYRSGLKKLAVCKDLGGAVHVRSATCTHMGCVVHWNSLEQCWDCPCHGSQFAPDGTALNGPAITALADEEERAAAVEAAE